MKSILLFFVACTFSVFAQETLLAMKGDFIYYEFKETTNNKNRCIKQYFCSHDSTVEVFQPALDLKNNVELKCNDLNKISIWGKETVVGFDAPLGSNVKDCLGDIPSPPGSINFILSGDVPFLESTLLGSLLNSNKFKVSAQMIVPTMKIKFYSKNEYSIVFTNFKITYAGTKGNEDLYETLDLETVYRTLLEKGKQNGKMYDNSLEAFRELDKMIKFIAKTYSDELKRIYQIDEL